MWAHGDFELFLKGQNYMISMDMLMNKKKRFTGAYSARRKRLCRLTCEHGFEIVGRGGHHGAVYGESFVAVPSHQCDVT